MTLFFMHIPKTAGSTLRQVFTRQFDEHDIHQVYDGPSIAAYGERSDRDRFRLVIGHFPFGVHQGQNQPCRYATMFRHPVHQVLSHYNHLASEQATRRAWFVEKTGAGTSC
jgi:hypothetical protein